MKLKTRLYLFAALASMLLLSVAGGGIWGLLQLGAALEENSRNAHALHSQGQADMMHDALRADVLTALMASLGRDEQALSSASRDVGEHGRLLLSSLQAARATLVDVRLQQRIDSVFPQVEQYVAAAGRIVQRARAGHASAGADYPAFLVVFSALEDDLGALGDAISQTVKQAEQAAERQRRLTQWTLFVLTALACGGLITLLTLSGRALLRVLGAEPSELEQCIRRLSAGDLSQLPGIAAADRSSLYFMLGVLQSDLQQAVMRIRSASAEVLGRSDHLAEASGAISAAASQQSQSATAMAAAVEEVTVAISQVAASCEGALGLSVEARGLAQQGGSIIKEAGADMDAVADVVRDSSAAISRLEQESDRISGIVAVIREVAEQTNLLALNAAIEAARAGESGRGFAVVADEVRKLAERTASSTREITEMIAAVRHSTAQAAGAMTAAVERVHAGSGGTQRAAGALQQMDVSAEGVRHSINEISLAMREQQQASVDIAGNVERIAQMLENSNEAIRDVACSSDDLRQLAGQLQQAVSHFRLLSAP